MMKADVLSIFLTIKACTHYKLADGTITETLPYEFVNQKIVPVYTELPGWNTTLSGTSEAGLPTNLLAYVSFLEKSLGVPISLISIGPDRSQTILRSKGKF
jgi:adenylosuccinate synthase